MGIDEDSYVKDIVIDNMSIDEVEFKPESEGVLFDFFGKLDRLTFTNCAFDHLYSSISMPVMIVR